jgi:hypothetical protein
MRGLLLVLLIAIVIIVLIYTGTFSQKKASPVSLLKKAVSKTRETTLETKISNIMNALEMYYMDNNEYPEILDVLIPQYLRLENDLRDPWGSYFRLERDDEMNLWLISVGRDLVLKTEDDIRRRIQ